MSDDLKKPEEMDMYDEEIIKELEELDNEALDIDEELDFYILDFDDEEEPDYDWGMDELLDIPVICFGLKNSYVQGKLFEGSQALLYFADRIDEIKTVCQYCEKKATMNLRVVNGKAVYDGETIVVGDVGSKEDEFYVQVCREHYFNPPDFSRL